MILLKQTGQRGMTLLELAILMAIMAILAAIAVPVLSWSLERANQRTCVSHLREIGVALESYRQDNNGNLPEMQSMRSSRSEQVPVLDTVLLPYVNDPEIFRCPADRNGLWETSGCSYWWYDAVTLRPDGSRNYLVIESVFLGTRDLSKIPLILDKEGFHTGKSKINACYADGHAGPLLDSMPTPP